MFIKLKQPYARQEVWVQTLNIQSIYPLTDGGSVIVMHGDSIKVAESPDEIVAMSCPNKEPRS